MACVLQVLSMAATLLDLLLPLCTWHLSHFSHISGVGAFVIRTRQHHVAAAAVVTIDDCCAERRINALMISLRRMAAAAQVQPDSPPWGAWLQAMSPRHSHTLVTHLTSHICCSLHTFHTQSLRACGTCITPGSCRLLPGRPGCGWCINWHVLGIARLAVTAMGTQAACSIVATAPFASCDGITPARMWGQGPCTSHCGICSRGSATPSPLPVNGPANKLRWGAIPLACSEWPVPLSKGAAS
jgi:hypothetical protein